MKFTSGEAAIYFHTYYREKLDAFVAQNDLRSCLTLLEEFIASKPGFLKDLDQHLPLKTQNQKDLARYYGKLHGDLGDFYRDLGNQGMADRNYKEMDKLTAAGQ